MSSSTSYDKAPTVDDKISLVRLMLGGSTGASPLFTNAEIETVLAVQPIPTYAAATLWDLAAGQWSAQVDQSIGATSISLSKKAEAARMQADRLRAGGPGNLPGGDGSGMITAEMVVGGISIAERDAYAEDTDAIQPSFSIGMDDDPDGDALTDVNLSRWR